MSFFSKSSFAIVIIVAALSSLLGPKAFAQNFEWAKSAGGVTGTSIFPREIYVDASGYTYATGAFHKKTTFDNVELVTSTTTSYADIFIAKYAPDGKLLWVIRDGGSGNEYALNIVVDRNGDIYISGFFSKMFSPFECKIGDIVLDVEYNNYEYFIAKYDTHGKFKWVKQTHNSGNQYGASSLLTLDNQGNVILQGAYKGKMRIGDNTLQNDGKAFSLFTAKFHPDGHTLWATSQLNQITWETEDFMRVEGLAIDGSGNIYYAGIFKGELEFPDGPVHSKNGEIFFVKVDANGQVIWQKQIGNGTNDFVTDLELDSEGNPYLLLYITEPVIGEVSNPKGWGSFVAKFDQDGNAYQINSIVENGFCTAMSIGTEDKIFAIGHYNPQARIDCFLLNSTSSNHNDAFMISQDADGHLQWVKEIKSRFGMMTLDIQLDTAADNAYGLGYFSGDISFGNIKASPAGENGGTFTSDMFITKMNNIDTYAPPAVTGLSCEIPQEAVVFSKVALAANAGYTAKSVTYTWGLGNGEVKTTTAPTLNYVYTVSGTYNITVSATDEFGCTYTCSDIIEVSPLKPDIVIPNIFTPNGDGKNDVFIIKNYFEDKPFLMQIYNRWGKQVAIITDGRDGWDGAGCSTGLYFYSISIAGQEKKGWVELMR